MCGINGFNFLDKHQTEMMNKAIKHRGPDDEGVFADENVTLGHVRLAILDLSKAGKQPMLYEHGGKSAIIVFNGEIYNFAEIRTELEKKGYTFNSKTDTEVILASYIEYGFDCVNHFNGMWAFVIYDPNKKILFCSRDRLGVKPLHYFFDKGVFIFSSELKGILTHDNISLNTKEKINQDALSLYFTLGFIPSPYTIYNNTFKLEPRQSLIFDLTLKTTRKWCYYRLPKYQPIYDSKKLIEEGRALLTDAVRLRMVADVPIGAFLSGGLDSTTTVGIMKEFTNVEYLHTFSIGFEGEYDETPFINIAKDFFKTKHHHAYFKQNDFERLVDAYANFYDEPFGDYSGFPTFKLCKMTRQYITVALSGDGGDEIFGGYQEYKIWYRMQFVRKIPRFLRIAFSRIPAKENITGNSYLYLLKKAFKISLSDPTLFYAEFFTELAPFEIYRNWTSDKLKLCMELCSDNLVEIHRLYDLMFNTLPDSFLTKVDRASMAYALEARSPFLDYRFIEFSQRIPTEWKVDFFRSKKLLKQMIKDVIPDEIVHRGKKGFTPPLKQWLTDQKYDPFLKQASEYLKDLNPELFKFLKERVFVKRNKPYDFYRIRLFIFGKWFEKWIDKPINPQTPGII